MLGNFSFVVENRLAGSAFPKGSPDEVVDEVKRLGAFKTIVNLTEHPHPAAECLQTAGIAAVHMPIDDYKAPTLEQMNAFAALVLDDAHAPLLVHCRAGIGRTGTMLAVGLAALAGAGKAPVAEDFVVAVRSVRRGSLEVPDQVEAFSQWHAAQSLPTDEMGLASFGYVAAAV
jgi:protein-tyrosine phosphatase